MKRPFVPLSGTGWFRASVRKMHSRLFRSILRRFLPSVYHDPFRSPFGVPARFVLIASGNPPVAQTGFHVHPLSLLHSGAEAQTSSGSRICSGQGDAAFGGNSLTGLPAWRYN